MRRLLIVGLLLGLGFATTSCIRVKPWERELLGRQDMAWEPDGIEANRDSQHYSSKEASMPSGGGGGGGCGCN